MITPSKYSSMLEVRLNLLRDWGYNLGNGAYVVRFRAYREDHGVRLKPPRGSQTRRGWGAAPASSTSAATAISAG